MKNNPQFNDACKFIEIDPEELLNDFQDRFISYVRDATKNRVDANMSRLFPVCAFKNDDAYRKIDD